MGALMLLRFLIILLWPSMTTSVLPMAKPNCPDKCGNISVPYPFGFGDDKSCYRSQFKLTCNYSYNPPKLFMGNSEVVRLSLQGQQHVLSFVAKDCYNSSGQRTHRNSPSLRMGFPIFTFSDTENKFIVLGCDTYAYIDGSNGRNFTSGCNMLCNNKVDVINSTSCTGIGCCQTSIPKGFRNYIISLNSYHNHTKVFDFNPCSYAFLVDVNWFNFSVSDLLNFTNDVDAAGSSRVPIVFDWAVDNKTCEEAKKDPTTYNACGNNSVCDISKNGVGYSCNCSQGYQGNPYLPNGCQDIDECADPLKNPCNETCTNLFGTYKCSCPLGYHGDGKKDGSGCIPPQKPDKRFPVIPVIVGIGLCSLFLLIGSSLMHYALEKRKDNKLKQKFFEQNGGSYLKKQSSREGAKIYTAKELKQATNNYADNQILGRGGYGTVYKGILPGHITVAIKKSKVLDESQIEHFINEVVILSQINHRNVVRLLGFCLETEVPILVYEFVTNKTLFHHIHNEGCNSPISWDNRLRIAAETSEALAYLHSAASPPIIHRDIKSANILLDDNYMAKVADFGASRLVPLDQTQISTVVQGTVGYLDPEYLQTSQLTEKSDVYSFGIVLVELLTRKKAVCTDGPGKGTSLAMHFVTSIREGKVWDIIDDQITIKGHEEQLQEVIELVERCLRIKGEERPTMKEVAMELQGLRSRQRHPWVAQNPKEVECLLGEPSKLCSGNTIGYDSMTNQVLISLDGGR